MDLDSLRAQVTKQGSIVRYIKKGDVPPSGETDLAAALTLLKSLKMQLETAETATNSGDKKAIALRKKALEDVLLRKMFIVQSFEIYGGVAGFFDFGPPGCAVKANLLKLWRLHFIQAEKMLEIECTNLMPEIVLKTSGHVERFTDLMVKDMKTGECYRADKLLEEHMDMLLSSNDVNMTSADREKHAMVATKAESMSPEETHATITEYGITSPGLKNVLSFPVPFNLMFSSTIGPTGGTMGYLRPETAQGIFINFKRLLEYNAGTLPFAAAQIGSAFRNEIAPRGGLLRVREFQQAEIEHFVHPEDKSHLKFKTIENEILVLFPRERQLSDGKTVPMKMSAAVSDGVIANQSLAYFMARTALFVTKLGIPKTAVRFRQHLSTEMAHYATDCWDLEMLIGGSWVECAGHADRACYDLLVHAKESKVEMVGTIKYDAPKTVTVIVMKLNRAPFGKIFKKETQAVTEALESLRENNAKALAFEALLTEAGSATLGPDCTGKSYLITREMVTFTQITKQVLEEKFVPSVIEPSFGIGRVLTAVFEHCFYTRPDDEKRIVMGFRPSLAPYKVSILPLSKNVEFDPLKNELETLFLSAGLETKVDNSGVAIGRKYARADEVGIPFNVTIDFESIGNRTVTVRERDSCTQIRVPVLKVVALMKDLVEERLTWEDAMLAFPVVGSMKENVNLTIEVTSRGSFFRPKEVSQ